MRKDRDQQNLLKAMCAKSKQKPVTKVIPFSNDDVHRFLAKLDKFEAESRKSRLVVG